MRIALYHPWVYLRSGIERSFVELLSRSRHDWVIFTHRYEPDATYPELREQPVVELQPRVSVRRSFGPLLAAAGTILQARLPDVGARALLVSSEGLGDFIMARNRLPAAAYCHTPLKILHDPPTREALEASDRRKAVALRVLGPAFEALDRRMWRRFRHIFVNSAETRRRTVAAGLASPGRLEVLHPGVNTEVFTDVDSRRRPMFLVAGRIMWQKNIELAIDAFRLACARGSGSTMVIAGAVDEKSQPYLRELRTRAAGLSVTFEPDPADERLIELYRTCQAVVFPPRSEDWGMVPLEAMACGAPVVSVDAGGPRESVVDGVTGWLLPGSPSSFADRMLAIEALPERELERFRRAARERATLFGWDHFVRRIDEVMVRLAASGQ